MILLDTQVVIWAIGDDRRLGKVARTTIEDDESRWVSAMASWEVAMLVSKGRLTLDMPLERWFDASLAGLDAREVAVTGVIARDAGSLPGNIHGDPCDRIMIATARALGCPLLTSDTKILAYAAAGHLRALDARR